ncbi:MAG: phage tail sheath C-terminal domain-containing protein [Blastocatellia bacterium]
MPVPVRIPLGAPGIYQHPESPLRGLTGVRMDVCAFAGVAPRGPVRAPVIDEKWRDDRPCVEPARPRRRTVAVAVESFDEYRRLFGGFAGPGLLPYAVASFFEQGGSRAWIARIVHEYDNDASNNTAVAQGRISGLRANGHSLRLRARSEGSWGNRLRAGMEFSARPLLFSAADTQSLRVNGTEAAGSGFTAGTMLRLTLPGGVRVLRLAQVLEREENEQNNGHTWHAQLNRPLGAAPESAEIVTGSLTIADGAGRRERHEGLGFSHLHPRWIATVLCYESELVWPDAAWAWGDITTSLTELLPRPLSRPFRGGRDRYADITHEDFFDAAWTFGDETPGNGIYCLTQLRDLSMLVVPDLYSPGPLAEVENIVDPVSLAGPDFAPCVDLPPAPPQTVQPNELAGLRLDPERADERRRIMALQQRLVDLAERQQQFIALLDVPPRLNQRQILNWRAGFDSAWAAAWHPWLRVARRDDNRDALIRIPPAATAAGIIAAREARDGVPHGPANVLTAEINGVEELVSPGRHDELHPLGINVYLAERDGVRLTGARTLSRDPQWRQLSVRRLVSLVRRTLDEQMQWTVFEPNGEPLRAELRQFLRNWLRQLFRLGAFRGATEEQAFFVRCDETNNPPYVTDTGRLLVEIGVAPAEPLEFIVLRLAREGDGTLTLEETTR